MRRAADCRFLRSATALVLNGVANWTDVVLTGYLEEEYSLRVDCFTGTRRIPQALKAVVTLKECSAGWEPSNDFTGCVPCTGARYSDGGLHRCLPCPPAGAVCNDGSLQLLNGHYPADVRAVLAPFAPGATGFQGSPSSSSSSSSNTSSTASSIIAPITFDASTVLYACDQAHACRVSNVSRLYSCAEGYTGPLCRACDAALQYAKSGSECLRCWPDWVLVLFLVVAGLLLLCFMLYMALVRNSAAPSELTIYVRMILSFVQMLSSLGQFKAKATQTIQAIFGVTDTVGGTLFSFPPMECLFRMPYYTRFGLTVSLPVLVGVSIIITACIGIVVRAAVSKKHRVRIYRTNLSSVGVRSWEVPSIDKADGRCSWNRSSPVMRSLARYFRERTYLSPTLFVYFLFFNMLCTSTTSMFRCRGEVIGGVQYLDVDPLVPCYTAAHTTGMVIAGLLAAVFNVGIPLVLVLVLRRNASSLRDKRLIGQFGFLYNGYSISRRLYWWEGVVLLRKFLVLAVVSLVSDAFIQSLLGLVVLVAFLVLQVHAQPYARRLFNGLEAMVLITLTLTQVISLSYFRLSTEGSTIESLSSLDAIITFLLLFLNITCLGVLVGFSVAHLLRQRRLSQNKKASWRCWRRQEHRFRSRSRARSRTRTLSSGASSDCVPAVLDDAPLSAAPSPVPSPSLAATTTNPLAAVYSSPWSWRGRALELVPPGRRALVPDTKMSPE